MNLALVEANKICFNSNRYIKGEKPMRTVMCILLGLVLTGMGQKPADDDVVETMSMCDPEEQTDMPETFY